MAKLTKQFCEKKIEEYLKNLEERKGLVCAILDDYDIKKDIKSIEKAIEIAAKSLCKCDKKHYHQARIPRRILIKFGKELLKIKSEISKAKKFHELFKLVEKEGKKIHGIGKLAIYDVALRIGGYLGIEPKKIYSHAGTEIGLKKVIRDLEEKIRAKELLKQIKRDGYINKNELPEVFRSSELTPSQLEDILCGIGKELGAVRVFSCKKC